MSKNNFFSSKDKPAGDAPTDETKPDAGQPTPAPAENTKKRKKKNEVACKKCKFKRHKAIKYCPMCFERAVV